MHGHGKRMESRQCRVSTCERAAGAVEGRVRGARGRRVVRAAADQVHGDRQVPGRRLQLLRALAAPDGLHERPVGGVGNLPGLACVQRDGTSRA